MMQWAGPQKCWAWLLRLQCLLVVCSRQSQFSLSLFLLLLSMSGDTEHRREVWEGKIPVSFILSHDELQQAGGGVPGPGGTGGLPEPVFVSTEHLLDHKMQQPL